MRNIYSILMRFCILFLIIVIFDIDVRSEGSQVNKAFSEIEVTKVSNNTYSCIVTCCFDAMTQISILGNISPVKGENCRFIPSTSPYQDRVTLNYNGKNILYNRLTFSNSITDVVSDKFKISPSTLSCKITIASSSDDIYNSIISPETSGTNSVNYLSWIIGEPDFKFQCTSNNVIEGKLLIPGYDSTIPSKSKKRNLKPFVDSENSSARTDSSNSEDAKKAAYEKRKKQAFLDEENAQKEEEEANAAINIDYQHQYESTHNSQIGIEGYAEAVRYERAKRKEAVNRLEVANNNLIKARKAATQYHIDEAMEQSRVAEENARNNPPPNPMKEMVEKSNKMVDDFVNQQAKEVIDSEPEKYGGPSTITVIKLMNGTINNTIDNNQALLITEIFQKGGIVKIKEILRGEPLKSLVSVKIPTGTTVYPIRLKVASVDGNVTNCDLYYYKDEFGEWASVQR